MKKKATIGIVIIITLLLSISVYAYVNNLKMSEYIKENSILREKTIILGDIRTGLIKGSQFERLYFLTQKEIYKKNFDDNLKSIYRQIDDLYNNDYITSTEKKKLIITLNDYNSLSSSYFNFNYGPKIDDSDEKFILDYNQSQLKILNDITLDLTSLSEDFNKKDTTISSISNLQTKLVQVVSSAITFIISGFLYYFKKKLNKDNIDIEDIIEYLAFPDDKKMESETSTSVNKDIIDNIENLDTLRQHIIENEILLSNAKLLYNESILLKKQCEKSQLILSDIDRYLKKLKSTIVDINEYPITAQKIILEDMENQIIELKISFKSLPYYNDFIIDISKNMIHKEKEQE